MVRTKDKSRVRLRDGTFDGSKDKSRRVAGDGAFDGWNTMYARDNRYSVVPFLQVGGTWPVRRGGGTFSIRITYVESLSGDYGSGDSVTPVGHQGVQGHSAILPTRTVKDGTSSQGYKMP
jgi:hypothetical protein